MTAIITKDYVINNNCKRISDNVHRYILISNLAKNIIDNPIFQRLRKLKQLGSCIYVFHNAVHTRFEHSLGTYHLADRILRCINTRTDPSTISEYLKNIPELQSYYARKYSNNKYILDDYVCELIKIAALCHDIGHGSFSHIFDDWFMPHTIYSTHPNANHEHRSCVLLEMIIKNDPLLKEIIKDQEIQFIKNLINPQPDHIGFIYQIVSNNLNGMDVDKYDYITRDAYVLRENVGFDYTLLVDDIMVIDNNICYPGDSPYEAFRLFRSRYDLHKRVYGHKSVIAYQLMIVEIFSLLDPILNISESVTDMERFCKMTDEYILTSIDHLSEKYCTIDSKYIDNVVRAANIIKRINNHDSYVFIGKLVTNNKPILSVESCIKIMELDDNNTVYKNNLLVYQSQIGYVSGNKKSPLDKLLTCSTKITYDKPMISKKVDITEMSHLIPTKYQEYITMVFYKDRTHQETIRNLREKFELVKSKLV